MSIKAKSILEQADVVIYDNLVNPKVLNGLPEARSIFVGKSLRQHLFLRNQRTLAEAKNDVSIARLKGGDPLVFGRVGEEVNALDSAEFIMKLYRVLLRYCMCLCRHTNFSKKYQLIDHIFNWT